MWYYEPVSGKESYTVICTWSNNRRVISIFNFLGKDSISQANPYDRKFGKIIQVPRPASAVIYNRFMGGIEKGDMLLSLYCSKMRSSK